MKRSNFVFLIGLTAILSLTACSGNDDDGCSSDNECKGERVCVSGECVTEETVNNANNQNNANNTNVNNDAATRDDCIGDYFGNYSGDITGSLDGSIDSSGALIITFTSGNETLDAEGQITESGTVVAGASIVSIDGMIDFEACELQGTWQNASVNASGTWTAVQQ